MSTDIPQLSKQTPQWVAINKAVMAIVSELSLDKVLKQIVDSACELVGAQYGALGVANVDGYLDLFVHSGMTAETVAAIPHLPRGFGLLGAIIKEKRSIRLPHIGDDPRSFGFPEGHPPMSSFLGVPIVSGKETLGNLYLTNKRDGKSFTLDDQEMVEMLAAHAAVAIENARLYEQVGRLAILEERTRIGMDLHDGIIQSIYAVGLTLESARLAMPETAEEADILLGHAINTLNSTIRDIRNYILDLRPHRFRGDLKEGLARLAREFQANTMVQATFDVPDEVVEAIPTPVARAAFLTAQEAMANVARHAQASEVILRLEQQKTAVVLTISDNGRGFDLKAQDQATGHGLANMRMRAEDLRGRFSIDTNPGQGTTLTIQFPYR
ncbi:MAG: GAF domain-containing sensor histidine kinase [Chloroflexota bacterium]